MKFRVSNTTAGGLGARARARPSPLQTTGGRRSSRPIRRQGAARQAFVGQQNARQGFQSPLAPVSPRLQQGQTPSGSPDLASDGGPGSPPGSRTQSDTSPSAPINLDQPGDGGIAMGELTAAQQAAMTAGLAAMGVITGVQDEEKKLENRLAFEALRQQVADFDAEEEEAKRMIDAENEGRLQASALNDSDDVDMDDSDSSWLFDG
ncbi:hypothetical protein DL95DRAFT_379264 [Leptodontidium sp. 2 PMI_412]|nr:hypothetical protein DL95DRAFT_379264 [Leptodontidium sp. 2 PMI_412]